MQRALESVSLLWMVLDFVSAKMEYNNSEQSFEDFGEYKF